ncbi:NAD-dependent epimerase/dehydratase family protein [Bifidobacterium sp. BRDM6]|uniref:NAD-dependent epimerase/dehydratase family protein n=2 Tax=Bifidobacterium choloepi TaxID=2614131 RepID=A0A6I5N0D0_9BIFI|nr:NAD-dependent epimerase/dehydratase family protein [Bifidobacterium choloepi]
METTSTTTATVKHHLDLAGRTVLVTGAAGFIGAALCRRLVEQFDDITVVGVDNFNDYYDVSLKESRVLDIECAVDARRCLAVEDNDADARFELRRGNIADRDFVNAVFDETRPSIVVNLAAQAGVRNSIDQPERYVESNIVGFFNVLEAVRNHPVDHFVFASSSSVYGKNRVVPFSTEHCTDQPVSLYAATKKSNELLAYSYSELYDIPTTGLRFFTVYGPAGRPDMAYFSFADKLTRGEKIQVFNYGDCERDFTYIDDVVEGIVRVLAAAPVITISRSPFAIYNIGKGHPDKLVKFIILLADELKRAGAVAPCFDASAHLEFLDAQPGDVPVTFADTVPFERDFSYCPSTSLKDGLEAFVQWYVAACEQQGRGHAT